jgi:hypothetical protein
MKLDLVKDLDAEEISKIWIQKHLEQEDSISAVVPAETYKKMLKRSKEYPLVRTYPLETNFFLSLFLRILFLYAASGSVSCFFWIHLLYLT